MLPLRLLDQRQSIHRSIFTLERLFLNYNQVQGTATMLLTLQRVTKQGAVETSNFQHSNKSSDNCKSTFTPSIYLALTLGICVLYSADLTANETASYKLPKIQK